MAGSSLEASVGMSRKWDAREAGREVARSVIRNLSRPPDLFLLYSTIHYKKHGGFQRFLNGVWDILPNETPLLGGTVAGFLNNYGCYTRGATALALAYPNMDVKIGIGENTRRNPKKAADKCANDIKNKQNKFHNTNILIDVLPGPERPTFFGKDLPIVSDKGFIDALGPKYLELSVKYLQKGQGYEEEVIDQLAKDLPDYILFGGSSADSNDLVVNYQFVDKDVKRNTLAGMGINTDLFVDYTHTDGLESTGVEFKISKTAQGARIVKELDGKSAAETFFGKIGIPKNRLDDRILRTTFFYPLGFKTKDDYVCPNAIGAVLNNSIAFNYKIQGDHIELLTTSGKMLIGAVNEAINKLKINNPKVGFIISCLARLETLGDNIFRVRERLLQYFKDSPFLLIYSSGENIRFPNEEPHHFNETFNILVATDKLYNQ